MDHPHGLLAVGGANAFLHSVCMGKPPVLLSPSKRSQPLTLTANRKAKEIKCCRSHDASSVLGTSHWCQRDLIQNCCHCWRSLPSCWQASLWSRNIHCIQWSVGRLAGTTAVLPKGDTICTHVDPSHSNHLARPLHLAEDTPSRRSWIKYASCNAVHLASTAFWRLMQFDNSTSPHHAKAVLASQKAAALLASKHDAVCLLACLSSAY